MEICEDIFLSESRKPLCHKDLSGFYGFIRSYENRPLSNYSYFHFSVLLSKLHYIITQPDFFLNTKTKTFVMFLKKELYCRFFSVKLRIKVRKSVDIRYPL